MARAPGLRAAVAALVLLALLLRVPGIRGEAAASHSDPETRRGVVFTRALFLAFWKLCREALPRSTSGASKSAPAKCAHSPENPWRAEICGLLPEVPLQRWVARWRERLAQARYAAEASITDPLLPVSPRSQRKESPVEGGEKVILAVHPRLRTWCSRIRFCDTEWAHHF